MKKPRLKTRVWVLILAAIAGTCLLAILAPRPTPKQMIANIYVDGVLTRRVDLNAVTKPERYRAESHAGFNDILIEPGRICVEAADCPDQICVMEGWLPEFGLPIVCLPHDLMIELEEDAP